MKNIERDKRPKGVEAQGSFRVVGRSENLGGRGASM